MELKEYLKIIKNNFTLFIGIAAFVVLAVFAFFYLRPPRFDVSLTLNITRAGSQETVDYKYDDFYRLQADEKFAETVVEWLKSPRIISDIYAGSAPSPISAEKRSSQVVAVNFSSPDTESAKNISSKTVNTLQSLTSNLNKDQKESNWFEIAAEEPVIARHRPNFEIIFLGSLFAGIFLGFWVVMVKHYLE